MFWLIIFLIVAIPTGLLFGLRYLARHYFKYSEVLGRISTVLWLIILAVLFIVAAIKIIF